LFKEDLFFGIKFDTFDIMKKIIVLSFILPLILSSCYIADNMLLESQSTKEPLNLKVEKEISNYIKENAENYIYKNYGFSELIIKKPAELIVLDDLKRKQAFDSTQVNIKTQILEVESIIKAKNLKYSLEMDHEYALRNKKTGEIELFETKFTLADSLKVKNIKPLLNITLLIDDVAIFENYFYETPIFLSGTYLENRNLSSQFYNFLKEHQNELTTIKEKSDFLIHSLNLCKEIKKDGTFDQSYYLLKLADKEIRSDSTILNYKSIEYSGLFETIVNEKITNYHYYHSFKNSTSGVADTALVYIEFSPYYELRSISTPSNTYEKYFND